MARARAGGGRRAALSPSRAKDFMQCPLMFRLRTVDRLPEPGSLATHKGTVVHGVLERLYDLPASERLPQAALELLPGQWASHREKNPEVMGLFEGSGQVETWLEEARGLIRTYFTLENPQRLEPAERELFVQTETGDGLLLRGFVDRLDVAPDGTMRVVDYKTGRSPGTRFMEEALFQMRFYALVLWRLRGRAPARRGTAPDTTFEDLGFRVAQGAVGKAGAAEAQGWSASDDRRRAGIGGLLPVGWTPYRELLERGG